MQEDFDLETVLSLITGVNRSNNWSNIFELLLFIFEEEDFGQISMVELIDIAKKHILNIHPELNNLIIDTNITPQNWINNQKAIFGNSITISILGEPVIKLKKQ